MGVPFWRYEELTAVYGALAYLIAETQATWRAKIELLAFALMLAFLTGISRIYLVSIGPQM